MKGVLFNVVEDVVVAGHGPDLWDDVVESSGTRGAYTSLGSYPDEDLDALLAAFERRTGTPREVALVAIGRAGFAPLLGRHPQVLDDVGGTGDLVHALNALIHPEVRKLYEGAEVPDFEVLTDHTTAHRRRLEVVYRSRRQLCSLAEGLLLGAGDHFHESVVVTHTSCRRSGDPACGLAVTIAP